MTDQPLDPQPSDRDAAARHVVVIDATRPTATDVAPADTDRRPQPPPPAGPRAARPRRRRDRYSPPPERRPRLDDEPLGRAGTAPATPERWFEPAPRRRGRRRRPVAARRSSGVGTVLAASPAVRGPRVGRHVRRARPRAGALDRPGRDRPGRTPTRPSVASRSRSTSRRRSSTSPPRPARPSSGSSTEGVDPNATDLPEQTGVGSGVIFNPNGWILTNRHVVAGSNTLDGRAQGRHAFTGTVYGIDTLTDLAIVKVDATGLTAAGARRLGRAQGRPARRRDRQPARDVLEHGHERHRVGQGPRDPDRRRRASTTSSRPTPRSTPATAAGRSSTRAAAVIGINTAIARDSSGIGFSIPINIAKPIMEQAVAGKELQRPYIGIRYEADRRPAREGPVAAGRRRARSCRARPTRTANPPITPGSPAAAAGIQPGDIITAIDETAIDTEHPLDAVLAQSSPGDTVDAQDPARRPVDRRST